MDLFVKKSLIRENSVFGVVDSVTHTSNLIMPIDCNILETNRLILEVPELINISPFKHGWILKFKAKKMYLLRLNDCQNLMVKSNSSVHKLWTITIHPQTLRNQ